MPALPTLTVTQAIADRLLAAFDGQVDETGAALTPVQAYKSWLRQHLVLQVTRTEADASASALDAQIPLT